MSKTEKVLTFETSKDGDEIQIIGNRKGLEDLKQYIDRLLQSKSLPNHSHLMTPSWGGNELTEDKQDLNGKLLNSVRIVILPS